MTHIILSYCPVSNDAIKAFPALLCFPQSGRHRHPHLPIRPVPREMPPKSVDNTGFSPKVLLQIGKTVWDELRKSFVERSLDVTALNLEQASDRVLSDELATLLARCGDEDCTNLTMYHQNLESFLQRHFAERLTERDTMKRFVASGMTTETLLALSMSVCKLLCPFMDSRTVFSSHTAREATRSVLPDDPTVAIPPNLFTFCYEDPLALVIASEFDWTLENLLGCRRSDMVTYEQRLAESQQLRRWILKKRTAQSVRRMEDSSYHPLISRMLAALSVFDCNVSNVSRGDDKTANVCCQDFTSLVSHDQCMYVGVDVYSMCVCVYACLFIHQCCGTTNDSDSSLMILLPPMSIFSLLNPSLLSRRSKATR